MEKIGNKSKVVVVGLGGMQRETGGPWNRADKKGNNSYYRVKEKEEVIHAKRRINELSNWGKEVGREIREEEQKEKNLEGKVISIITIGSLLISVLFLSFNITGNAIADLSVKSSSLVGVGLFAIALISGFFWLRNRKK